MVSRLRLPLKAVRAPFGGDDFRFGDFYRQVDIPAGVPHFVDFAKPPLAPAILSLCRGRG